MTAGQIAITVVGVIGVIFTIHWAVEVIWSRRRCPARTSGSGRPEDILCLTCYHDSIQLKSQVLDPEKPRR